MYILRRFLFAFVCSVFCLSAIAQRPTPSRISSPIQASTSRTFSPKWSKVGVVSLLVNGKQKQYPAPVFEGCLYDENIPNLPYTLAWIPVKPFTKIEVSAGNISYKENPTASLFTQPVQDAQGFVAKLQGEWYPSSHIVVGNVFHRGSETLQEVRIYPILVSRDGKHVQQATHIPYTMTPVSTSDNPPQPFRAFAPHSVLKDGEWFKLAVNQDGIYKLDYNYLNSIGVNLSGLDPKTIRIFGNGGETVPQANAVPRPDDLLENPIQVVTQNTGTFGAGDYILFYGQAPSSWKHNPSTTRFEHVLNVYSDTNFYFLNIGQAVGKRIQPITPSYNPTHTITSTTNYSFYETEKENFGHTGRYWVGEYFNTTTQRRFALPVQDHVNGTPIKLSFRVAGRSDVSTYFSLSVQNNTEKIISLSPTLANIYQVYNNAQSTFTLSGDAVSGDSVAMSITFNKNNSGLSEGWLEWIEVEYQQDLNVRQRNQRMFTLSPSIITPVTAGNISLTGLDNSYQIWDITHPTIAQKAAVSFSGSSANFATDIDTIRRFIAFNGGYKTPFHSRKMISQDLHALELADYIMLVPPALQSEAERLAEFHRTQLGHSVHIVNPTLIYNEFSGGKTDVAGIRDFLKMFHDRSQGAYPKYVLMFGDGSYDHKNIKGMGNNFVPTYQSRNYNDQIGSYTSDDFFVFLSDEDGFFGENSGLEGDFAISTGQMDAAVGRLPVESLEEAKDMVDKIISYNNASDNFGVWKNKAVLVADYKEGEGVYHMAQSDNLSTIIEAESPCMNMDKVFFDNYSAVITGSGMSFPDARKDILTKLDEGSLVFNWTGHGSETAWSNSFVLQNTDIGNVQNEGRMPLMITATCEFGRYDNPAVRSGAEIFALAPHTGSIGMFTTVRVVEGGGNYALNSRVYQQLFEFDSLKQRMPTIGEVMQAVKNDIYKGISFNLNSRNFSLLGDPGLTLSYPKWNATITSINGKPFNPNINDTIPTLQEVEITGKIQNTTGTFQPDFNGNLYATIYDKPNQFITKISNFPFLWQKNRIFNGSSSIQNGLFSFKFVVPIDVSYDNGFGKISMYVNNASIDGVGCYNQLVISGTSAKGLNDKTGPDVELYINDENWMSGGTTFPDPDLYATVSDESGINITSTGIGHEITTTLNGEKSITLNDYYTAKKNSYKEGTIRYKMRELPLGEYEAKIRVWDVANNPSEARTKFIIAENAELALTQILNYPNPFSTHTEFFIGHNQVGKDLYAQIKIFTISGKLVKVLASDFYGEGNYFRGLDWDGLDEYGDRIGRGTYVYQVTLKERSSGKSVSKFEKMVLLR